MKKQYKAINYRFYDKEEYQEFMKKIQFDEDSSFQDFVNKAIGSYLRGEYNPYDQS